MAAERLTTAAPGKSCLSGQEPAHSGRTSRPGHVGVGPIGVGRGPGAYVGRHGPLRPDRADGARDRSQPRHRPGLCGGARPGRRPGGGVGPHRRRPGRPGRRAPARAGRADGRPGLARGSRGARRGGAGGAGRPRHPGQQRRRRAPQGLPHADGRRHRLDAGRQRARPAAAVRRGAAGDDGERSGLDRQHHLGVRGGRGAPPRRLRRHEGRDGRRDASLGHGVRTGRHPGQRRCPRAWW